MVTETELDTEPVLSDAPPCWPPLAHLIRLEDEPVKEGTIALCGKRLMGIDLGRLQDCPRVCAECVEVAIRIMRGEAT